ncbi:MAG: caspase family protein [Dehalococcoidia bacterium]
MVKLALLVGIDDYAKSPLSGCVNDANQMANLLQRNYDGSPNFECKNITAPTEVVTRIVLKEAVDNLFKRKADVALFYFSGHGTVNSRGGYLVTQDTKGYDEGLSMVDLLTMANNSPAKERIIILDCCHSGAFGQVPAISSDLAFIEGGVSILSACREEETAMEKGGQGLFTSLVCSALDGGAAEVGGNVTIAGVYAYLDEALGGWDQRPLFKGNVSKLVPIRSCKPAVDLLILRMLPSYFKVPSEYYQLDPSYEPTENPRNPDHEEIFRHLQQLRDARLVIPVGEDHLYYAAVKSKACKLTPMGVRYWYLAKNGKI